MEEYLQYMKTLRSQMNDVEDQAAKISVEEQMLITTIQNLEKELDLAKSEFKQLQLDTDQMVETRGQVCSQILGNQKKIASLESDSSTLTQTLELILQEKHSLSAKLEEKSFHYTEVADEINSKLKEQKDWMNSHKVRPAVNAHESINGKVSDQTGEAAVNCSIDISVNVENVDDVVKDLATKFDSAKSRLDLVIQAKSKLVSQNSKVKSSVDSLERKMCDFKPELHSMNVKTLEEEYQALLSDRSGENEYLLSLQQQFEKLKEISHVVRCACGEEYKVQVEAEQGLQSAV